MVGVAPTGASVSRRGEREASPPRVEPEEKAGADAPPYWLGTHAPPSYWFGTQLPGSVAYQRSVSVVL